MRGRLKEVISLVLLMIPMLLVVKTIGVLVSSVVHSVMPRRIVGVMSMKSVDSTIILHMTVRGACLEIWGQNYALHRWKIRVSFT